MWADTAALTRLRAFGCGATAAVLLIAGFEVVRAQPTAGAAIAGCADDQGKLRLTEAAVSCRPGERRLRLGPPRIDRSQDCGDTNAVAARLESRIRDLEYRARRGTLRGIRVTAPFEVVTKAGQRLLYIEEENVTFHSLDGPMVRILADETGGNLVVRSSTGLAAQLGALHDSARLLVQEKDRDRVDLGRMANGRVRLGVFGTQEKLVAGIGQSAQGSGLALVADAEGRVSARLNVPGGNGTTGEVAVFNAREAAVASLTVGPGGAGRLEMTDASGNLMVQAGATDGVGVVRTGPGMYNFNVGFLGLAPSMIIGKQ